MKSKSHTYIFVDYQNSRMKIYGAKSDMQISYEQILQSLSVFEDGIQCYEILLKSGRPPGLMKYLISEYGSGLKTKIELLLFISVPATKSYDDISVLVNECSGTLESCSPNFRHQDQIECCVCYTGIKASGDIFRLEYCGHVYCRECISQQIAPTALCIPVECAADQCSQPFVWKDFQNLSVRIGLDLRSFITASVRFYAAAHPNLVRYCPTPDCPVIYTVSSDSGKRFFCNLCGVSTCTKCHDIYHEGITCEEYKDSKEKSKELEEWMQKNTKCRKRCPKCDVPIEKIKGCNHIHCRQCSADICWVCLKYFDSPSDCYSHLHDVHRGLWDPQ